MDARFSRDLAARVIERAGKVIEWQIGSRAKELRRFIKTARNLGLLEPGAWAALRLSFEIPMNPGRYGPRESSRDMKIIENEQPDLLQLAMMTNTIGRGYKFGRQRG